jgi:hypothetical protein
MNWKAIGVGVAAVAAAVALWFSFKKPDIAPHSAPMEAPAAAVVEDVTPQPIQPAKVTAYPARVKQKSNLPDAMKQDPNVVVLDSSAVGASDQDQTVTSTLNTQTGEVATIVSENPNPWFQPEAKNEARLSYGVKNGMKQVTRASIGADLLQIKAIHLGFSGSVDSDGSFFMGAGIAYKW